MIYYINISRYPILISNSRIRIS